MQSEKKRYDNHLDKDKDGFLDEKEVMLNSIYYYIYPNDAISNFND